MFGVCGVVKCLGCLACDGLKKELTKLMMVPSIDDAHEPWLFGLSVNPRVCGCGGLVS